MVKKDDEIPASWRSHVSNHSSLVSHINNIALRSHETSNMGEM